MMKSTLSKSPISRRRVRRLLVVGSSGRARALPKFLPVEIRRRRRYRLAIAWQQEEWTGFEPVIQVRSKAKR